MKLLAVCLLLLVTACAPATLGTSSLRPYSLNDGDDVLITSGSTGYVSRVFSFRHFDFASSDFGNMVTRSPSVGQTFISSARGKLQLTASDVPEGWSLTLANAQAVKRVTEVSSSTVWFLYTVEAVTTVEVPPGTPEGMYNLNATLVASTGKSQQLRFVVTVIDDVLAVK